MIFMLPLLLKIYYPIHLANDILLVSLVICSFLSDTVLGDWQALYALLAS